MCLYFNICLRFDFIIRDPSRHYDPDGDLVDGFFNSLHIRSSTTKDYKVSDEELERRSTTLQYQVRAIRHELARRAVEPQILLAEALARRFIGESSLPVRSALSRANSLIATDQKRARLNLDEDN